MRNADAVSDRGDLPTKASRASPPPKSSWSLMELVRKEKTTASVLVPQEEFLACDLWP